MYPTIITANSPNATNDKFDGISSLKMYPNPSQGVFQLSGDIADLEGAKVVVYDVLGKKVYENASPFDYSGDATIDISSCSAGIYLVEISRGSIKDVRKLVKK